MKRRLRLSGVYMIQSISNEELFYIGGTKDILKRWIGHLSILKRHIHHSRIFQSHYDKYGKEDLRFIILHECSKEELKYWENYYIKKHYPLLNICPSSFGMTNFKHSEKSKDQMRKSHEGKKPTLGKHWNWKRNKTTL